MEKSSKLFLKQQQRQKMGNTDHLIWEDCRLRDETKSLQTQHVVCGGVLN